MLCKKRERRASLAQARVRPGSIKEHWSRKNREERTDLLFLS